jgi:hypothetical protein
MTALREDDVIITADYLMPGQELYVKNQPRGRTPIATKVIVHWVGPSVVRYKRADSEEIKEIAIDRFLKLINL